MISASIQQQGPTLLEQLIAKIHNPDLDIKDILTDSMIIRAYLNKNREVCNYINSHARDILKIALTGEKDAASKTTFQLICCNSSELIFNFLRDGYFQNIALDILNETPIKPFIIGRLSSITLLALGKNTTEATDSCGFIYHLIPFCGNPSVDHFFETICSESEQYEFSQKWLMEMGFVEFLLRELESIDYEHKCTEENPFFDPIFGKCFSIYQLISICISNKILGQFFKTRPVVDILSKFLTHAPPFVMTAHWKAIKALTCEETSSMMISFVPQAVKVLSEDIVKLHEFRVLALETISKIGTMVPMVFETFLSQNLLQKLLNLMLIFPNCTIYLESLKKFIQVSLTHSDFAFKMVSLYLPVVGDIITEQENHVLFPYAVNIFDIFYDAAKRDPILQQVFHEYAEFEEVVRNHIVPFKKTLNDYYGEEKSTIKVFANFFS